MSEPEKEQDNQPTSLATSEERLWVGVCLFLAAFSLGAAYYLEIVHGSSQWQASFVFAFVGYLFAACAIGSKGDAFVEPDKDDKEKKEKD